MNNRAAKIEKTRQLAEKGYSYREMATVMGEAFDTVRQRCKNHQITVTNKQKKANLSADHKEKLLKGLSLINSGMTITEAARQSGANVQTLYYHAHDYRIKRRKQKAMQILQISKMVGVSTTTKKPDVNNSSTLEIINNIFNSNPIIHNPNRLPAW